MANLNNGNNGEPSNAPQAGRWYNLSLGSSFKDNPSTKFCTLRYEFKPASIDKSQPASLHKNKDNRVTVEFSNNQPGKPKLTFEGSSEDYKEHDGVLFFDGESFRLERLHRAVKRLRHVRMPGESAAIAAAVANASTSVNLSATVGAGVETRSPPLARMGKSQPVAKSVVHSVPVEVERIDIGEPEIPALAKPANRPSEHLSVRQTRSPSPDKKVNDMEENFHLLFGDDDDDDDDDGRNEMNVAPAAEFDLRLPSQNDSDDEIADVDVSDNEGDKGPNAAEALRAEVNAEEDQQQTSSSSGSSGSGSRSSGSGSGSGSSSSDSEASDDDSASSGGDIDI